MCLGVTGLRGALSHRVVSEACHVLRLLESSYSKREPQTHARTNSMGPCVLVCFYSLFGGPHADQKVYCFVCWL